MHAIPRVADVLLLFGPAVETAARQLAFAQPPAEQLVVDAVLYKGRERVQRIHDTCKQERLIENGSERRNRQTLKNERQRKNSK
jgi:hypothetical protein